MQYRKEIDGLRALAVLPVVLYHAGIDFFAGGYVGVDVFFVISGYLITSLILSEVQQDKFSFVSFYERRARRLLPALFFLMIVCIPFAWLLLIPSELQSFGKSLISTSFFFSNILFWQESGYFGSPSELKPLIHTWSLAVEEQYYLLFPLLFLIFKKHYVNRLILILILVWISSLILSHWAAFNKPSANFYLLPTRIWEILSGALLSFFIFKNQKTNNNVQVKNILSIFGFGLIFVSILYFDDTTPFPSLYTLLPVTGSLLVIYFSDDLTLLGRLLSKKYIVFVGLISYSLYLWHQPILAFSRHYMGESLSNLTIIVLLIISFGISVFSYYFVESPFRKGNKKFTQKRIFQLSVFLMVLISASGYVLDKTDGFRVSYLNNLDLDVRQRFEQFEDNSSRDFFKDIRKNDCHIWTNKVDEKFESAFSACKDRFGEAVFVIGDSHAINLHNIVSENNHYKFLVGFSDGGCRPQHQWECFYDDLLNFLNIQDKYISKVIYHQSGLYLMEDRFGNINSVETLKEAGPPKVTYEAIDITINYLQAISKNIDVHWLGPHVENSQDLAKKILVNKELALEENSLTKNRVLNGKISRYFLDKEIDDINFILYDDFFLIETDFLIQENCLTYRDLDHFSICGEKRISEQLNLGNLGL